MQALIYVLWHALTHALYMFDVHACMHDKESGILELSFVHYCSSDQPIDGLFSKFGTLCDCQ